MTRASVLLATEDGYPFHMNDAGRAAKLLIKGMPDVDFTVLAVTAHPYLAASPLPANVRTLITLPLGGMEDPAEYGNHASFLDYIRRRAMKADHVTDYAELYAQFLRGVLTQALPPRALAVPLLGMHVHLQYYDYHRVSTEPAVWNTYVDVIRQAWAMAYPAEAAPTAADLAGGWRVIYRALLPLTLNVPRVDLAHATSAGPCALPCTIARIQHQTPSLIAERNLWLRDQYLSASAADAPFVRWLTLRVAAAIADVNYAYATQLTPASEFAARWARRRGVDESRVQVIQPGVAATPMAPLHGAAERPTIACIGDLHPANGQIDLIEAAALLRREFPHVLVELAGNDADAEYARRCHDVVSGLDLAATVRFTDPGAHARTASHPHLAVFLQRSGAIPYALLETMMNGIPIVASDVGGMRDALGDTGMLVPAGDPVALSQSLALVMQSPESCRRLGEAAHERALELFADTRFVNDYRVVYDRLLKRSSRSVVPAEDAPQSDEGARLFGAA